MMAKPEISKTLASCKHMTVEGFNHSRFQVDDGFFEEIHITHDDGKLVLKGLIQIVEDSP